MNHWAIAITVVHPRFMVGFIYMASKEGREGSEARAEIVVKSPLCMESCQKLILEYLSRTVSLTNRALVM